MELDEKKVIQELQKNANESIETIAKKCGFSRQKVWRIIKRLETNHFIWGYTAIIDDEKVETNSYLVLIKRTNDPVDETIAERIIGRTLEETAKRAQVHIETSLYVHGMYDWVILFTAQDIKQAKIFCEVINATYQGYIEKVYLLQTMFPVRKQGILNPELQKLREFL